ncbi:MAG: RNA polymerase sigma factor (sigma-70 family) [Sphingobacteriales bacterium]
MGLSEKELIKGCVEQNALCQKQVYDLYAGKMLGVCLRYAKNREEAEDIFQEAFIKIFQKIDTFRGEAKLSTWMRSVMVNTALKHLRSNRMKYEFTTENEIEIAVDPVIPDEAKSLISEEALLEIIGTLPEGYRVVFNMYNLEGFTHKEIAAHLEISENTSKSQLSRARKLLQKLVNEKLNEEKK